MSNLWELSQRYHLEGEVPNLEISAVAISSGFVEPNCLFVAAPGVRSHGLDYLAQAIELGAIAVLTDRPGRYPVPALYHPDPRSVAGLIAADIYQSSKSQLYAVTGTNGKTSTSYYLQRLLSAAGKPAGLLSSAEQIIGGKSQSAELTTPEAPRVHQLLQQMRAAGEDSCAIEVSAQALVRHRTDGLRFAVSGFTNLSRDHLDDFGDMDSYLGAKAKLFEPGVSDLAVVNVEDKWGEQLISQLSIPKVGIGSGLDYQFRLQSGRVEIFGRQQTTIEFAGGELMAKNLALAAVMLLATGTEIPQGVRIESSVPGRLHLVSEKTPHVYVDYAHTPAGVLAAVQEVSRKHSELTVVLGASGNRDRGKRDEMAKAAAAANLLVITDQHPRDEDPAAIRQQLVAAAREQGINYVEIPDPAAAIEHAVRSTSSTGAVLWCGPGHLKYREIVGEKVAFDAIDVARRAQGD